MAVWKIGSRWGNLGVSVLDLFLNYDNVFFDSCVDSNIGDWVSVKPGDYFLISDGSIPVAIGKSLGKFQNYESAKVFFAKNDYKEYVENYDVQFCPASIVILPKEEQNDSWSIDPQRRFCRYHRGNQELEDRVASMWIRLRKSQGGTFDIIPRAVSLFEGKDAIFSPNICYRIPKYQRAYSWGEYELRRLIESLRDALQSNEPVFMGTMQLSEPISLSIDMTRFAYNIIDGQQRITTFFILTNLLEQTLGLSSKFPENQKKSILQTWVSCGEEQLKLDTYFDFLENKNENVLFTEKNNCYLQNHTILNSLFEEYFKQDDPQETKLTLKKLYEFITGSHVKIVVIETHAGLSKTLKIFNTINTSGLSLGTEDVFKIRFYEYLKLQGEPESVFDQISEVYAKVEEYNRNPENTLKLCMRDILRSYQRILIAREDLNDAVFTWSYESFFEGLFDSLLGIRILPEFKSLQNRRILTIEDLNRIIECYEENFKMWDNDAEFRIARDMIWETRYGFIWDLPIIARFFDTISHEKILDFTWKMFKFLCPPSLYFAKMVSPVRSSLIDILKKLPKGIYPSLLFETVYTNMSAEQMLDQAFEYQIAWYPKCKNLICRLVEYLKSPQKDVDLYERLWCGTDIEHIQCVTDEKKQ